MSRNKGQVAAQQRAEKQLLVFQQISRFMAKDLPVHDVVEGIVRLVMQHLHCDSCFLYIKDGDELALCATHDRPVSEIGTIRLRLDEGTDGLGSKRTTATRTSTGGFPGPAF